MLATFELLSQKYDRNSLIGNSLETVLFFVSPLGFGVIILPVFAVLIYLLIRKNSTLEKRES